MVSLLALRVPAELRDEVAADLEEEHAHTAEASGRLRANLWYLGQLLLLRPTRLRRALRTLEGRWKQPGRTLPSTSSDHLMETLLQDLRHALRRLWATPGFTLIAILSLGMGIGANTAVFSLVGRILFFDTGVGEPETLVDVFQDHRGRPYWAISYQNYEAIRELPAFSDATAYFEFEARVESPAGDEMLWGELVAGEYFGTLRVPMAMGRSFTRDEQEVEGASPVAILDHRFWVRAFNSDPGAVGRTIRINTRPYTIVGVAPESFEGKALPLVGGDLYLPYAMRSDVRRDGDGSYNLSASARIAPGVTVAQARAALAALGVRLAEQSSEGTGFDGLVLYTADETLLRPGIDQPMAQIGMLLLGVVALVLLIACTNLASFLLARAADRRRELAVRLALGASRGRILRLLFAEAIVLGLLGGAAGAGIGALAVRLLLRVRPPFDFPLDVSVPLDGRVLVATAGISLVAAVLFGLAPALQGSRSDITGTLRDEAAGVIGGRRRWSLRGALVIAQVAVSLVLLTGAGLFVRSLVAAAGVDPGFEPAPVAIIQVAPYTSGYDAERARALYEDLHGRARALPTATAAALVSRLPMELGNADTPVRLPEWDPADGLGFEAALASPGFFDAFEIELIRGRDFGEEDRAGTPRSVILNEAAARRLWPNDPDPASGAVGRTLFVGGWPDPATVIGVAETTKIKTLSEAPRPYVWQALAQVDADRAWLVARGSEPVASLAGRLRSLANEIDPDLSVRNDGSAARTVALQLYLPRMGASILAAMGGIALVLAAIGLYGVVSYAVARREREVGIRLSLGAGRSGVVALMMRGGIVLVAIGGVVGMFLALAASRLVGSFLIGISPLDPVTFLAVPLLLVVVAALASYLPARRAARVDPMTALRSE
jgi:predicted permease